MTDTERERQKNREGDEVNKSGSGLKYVVLFFKYRKARTGSDRKRERLYEVNQSMTWCFEMIENMSQGLELHMHTQTDREVDREGEGERKGRGERGK